jgi:hypothetical protein
MIIMYSANYVVSITFMADPAGPAVYGIGLRPLACWDCGFESHQVHGYLFLANVVICQVEVSATDRSQVQRSPTEWCVFVCVCVYVCV